MYKSSFQKLLEEKGITQNELARRLGINKSSVAIWVLRRIPAERVLEIERETGIPRGELRPDLYPLVPDSAERSSGDLPRDCEAAQ